MFSSRLHWDLPPNRLAQALAAKRAAGAPILDLTESNPTRAGFQYPDQEILAALGDQRGLLYEPTPTGLLSARAAVAEHYAARRITAPPQQILLTASTSESYAWLFKLLAGPGDEVLVPRPSYPLFEFLAQLEAVRVVHYPLVYHDGWSIDLDALARCVNSHTRAVIVVNPNNPTGSFVKRQEAERLTALCAERDLAIISDEVFSDYAFGTNPDRVDSYIGMDAVLAFSLSGLSKIAALPQMKLGWLVVTGPPSLRAQACARLELIADTYLSVGTPVQHALPRLLESAKHVRQQVASRTRDNLANLRDTFGASSPVQVLQVEGGWYATVRVPRTKTEEEWCLELLEHDGVLVQPGFFYDFEAEAYLVLSLLTPPDAFREGVRRLAARL